MKDYIKEVGTLLLDVSKYMLKWLLAIGFILLVSNIITPMDSTDKSFFNRSGLTLYKDHKTGIEYLKGGFCGGITPRLK